MLPSCSHSNVGRLSISRSLFEENGRNGSKAIARFAVSCRHTKRMVLTRSGSVFHTFHGSHSVM